MDTNNGLFRGNAGEALRFFTRALKNNFLSEKAGRPVFDTALFVEIITPGSNSSVPEKMVERTLSEEAGLVKGERQVTRTADYERFKAQIEAYKANNGEYAEDGMPITSWAQIDTGTAHTLKSAGIHTVEQLGAVSDGSLQNLGTGGRHLRDQARAFITARQFGVPIAQQTAEVSQLRTELDRITGERDEALTALRQANQRIAALEQAVPKGAEANRTIEGAKTQAKTAKEAPPPPPEGNSGVI